MSITRNLQLKLKSEFSKWVACSSKSIVRLAGRVISYCDAGRGNAAAAEASTAKINLRI